MNSERDWGLNYYPLVETLGYYLEDDWSYTIDEEILDDWITHNISDIVQKIEDYNYDEYLDFEFYISELYDTLERYYDMKTDPNKVDEYGKFYSTLTDTLYPLIENKRRDLVEFIETSCKRDLRNVRIDTILEK